MHPFCSALPASAVQQQAALQTELSPATPVAVNNVPAVPAVSAVPALLACTEAPPGRSPAPLRAASITQWVPPKRPAPPPPAPAPIANKKARTSPYNEFYQEQRLLLPPGLRNAEREKLLGQMWKALPEAQRAKYHVGAAATPTPYHVFRQEQRPLLPPGLRNADRERLLGQMWKSLSEAEWARYQLPPELTPATSPAPSPAPVRYHAPAHSPAQPPPPHAPGPYLSGARVSPAAAEAPVPARPLAPAVVSAVVSASAPVPAPVPGRPPAHAPSISRAARDAVAASVAASVAAAWSNQHPKVDNRWYDNWKAAALEDRWNDRWKTKTLSAASNPAPPPPPLPPRRDLYYRSTGAIEDSIGSGSAGQAALALAMLSEHRPTLTRPPAAQAAFSQATCITGMASWPARSAQATRSPGRPACAPPARGAPWSSMPADPADPEEDRIAVWNQATGKKLTGQAAPKRRNLDKYLRHHPDYSILYEGGATSAAAAAANHAANNPSSLSTVHTSDRGSSPHRGSSTEGKRAHSSLNSSSLNSPPHSSRCGGGQGSVHGDCGECKNCLDKPKFGGRGIKKQACLRRSCYNPQEDSDESPSSPPSR